MKHNSITHDVQYYPMLLMAFLRGVGTIRQGTRHILRVTCTGVSTGWKTK